MAVLSRLFVVVALTAQTWLLSAFAQDQVDSTCNLGSKGFQFVISKASQQAVFKCGEESELKPKAESHAVTKVCPDNTCATDESLADRVPTATITESDGTYTFQLTKLPTTEQVFFLQCVSTASDDLHLRLSGSKDPCLIQFTVKTKPAGIEECASKEKNVDLKIEAAGKNVQFLCGDDLPTLQPATPTDVYKDSSCSQSVALTSIASGATLSTDKDTGVHTLAVPTLPSSQHQVCYKCLPLSRDESQACKVLVTLSAASTVVTTQKPSSAGQTAASVLLFLSLSFASLLHVF